MDDVKLFVHQVVTLSNSFGSSRKVALRPGFHISDKHRWLTGLILVNNSYSLKCACYTEKIPFYHPNICQKSNESTAGVAQRSTLNLLKLVTVIQLVVKLQASFFLPLCSSTFLIGPGSCSDTQWLIWVQLLSATSIGVPSDLQPQQYI